ncbi:MAG: SMC-Scp complex subunit ScpB [Candidatus Uhrbacteria bacterium]|nr:SMC-Scp complex subunit ScpB [Candidatus Uhrbacteria bacterium]
MNYPLASKIETLLFIAQRPLSVKKIAQLTGESDENVSAALEHLAGIYTKDDRGIILILHNDQAELATNPDNSDFVREYTKEEVSGELTRAGLETLTIIAYRGPLTKAQIEQIRGVNCTIVLRNLAMRGYIETTGESDGEKLYTSSFDFLRHLGIQSVADLPDYESLHSDERLDALLSPTADIVKVTE